MSVDAETLYRQAKALHQQGRPQEAERCYRTVLDAIGDHYAALYGLALLLAQQRDFAAAEALLFRAVAKQPMAAEAHANLGAVRRGLGRREEAVESYRRALAIDPDIVEARNNLANALRELGRDEEAIAQYKLALAARPDYAEAHNNYGIALASLGRIDEAISEFGRAIDARPGYARAHANLGNALQALGRHEEAAARYETAAAIAPNDAETHRRRAISLVALGRPIDAISHFTRAVEIRPDDGETHYEFGLALRELGRLEEARARLENAIAILPGHANAYNSLGAVHIALKNHSESVTCYRNALALAPDFAEAHSNLGIAHEIAGELDEAWVAFERAVEIAPRRGEFYHNLVNVRPIDQSDRHLAAMEALGAEIDSLPRDGQIALHFALGKAYDDLGRPRDAAPHFLSGNAKKRRTISYDEAATFAYLDRIAAAFTPASMHGKAGAGDASSMPVLIIGMPASGTTLVEQILASHPQAAGVGESSALAHAIAAPMQSGDVPPSYPEMVPSLTGALLTDIRRRYLAQIQMMAPAARRIVDKMPSNFVFAGLVHLALPNARIIHTRRDPIDTCFSCFTKLFAGLQPFTYELEELGRFYRAYDRLMDHWRAVLPAGVMLEVRYEDVVEDLATQAKRIIAHCGLEWDNACLGFHRTKRLVWSGNPTQVRQPIYRTSVQRWQGYREMLRPLLRSFEQTERGCQAVSLPAVRATFDG